MKYDIDLHKFKELMQSSFNQEKWIKQLLREEELKAFKQLQSDNRIFSITAEEFEEKADEETCAYVIFEYENNIFWKIKR